MKTCTSASVGIAALLLQASLVLDVAVAIPGWSDEKTSPGKQSRVAYGEDAADPLLTHFVELVISGDFGDASCGGTDWRSNAQFVGLSRCKALLVTLPLSLPSSPPLYLYAPHSSMYDP